MLGPRSLAHPFYLIGNVAELGTANVFMAKDGIVFTPAPDFSGAASFDSATPASQLGITSQPSRKRAAGRSRSTSSKSPSPRGSSA